jgi:hypothetical protein
MVNKSNKVPALKELKCIGRDGQQRSNEINEIITR